MSSLNTKKINIIIPNEIILNKITKTPAFRMHGRNLEVGDNIQYVNHVQFSHIMRMLPIAGCEIMEVLS